MPNLYVTIEEVQLHLFQGADRDTPRLESLIEYNSRLLDKACGLQSGYFAKSADGASATARVFWGDGTDLLKLDPYVIQSGTTSITGVTMPTGWTVPAYVELGTQSLRSDDFDFGLVRTYGDDGARLGFLTSTSDDGSAFALDLSGDLSVGWPSGVKVTVTAKWGYLETPADVKLAVIEMVIASLRGADQAYARTTNLDTNTVTNASALTPRAQLIADRYSNARAAFA